MPDMITGVVVLQRIPAPGGWRLWFQYTRQDGLIGYSTIPMKPKGTPKPEGHTGPLWDFDMQNPTLHCSPSVRILGAHDGDPDHFHNAGQWSNPFVIMAKPYPEAEDPDSRDVCMEINKFKTKEECDRVILDFRAKGILE